MSYHNNDIAACGHATCPSRHTCLRWQLGQRMEYYHLFGEFNPKDGQCKYFMYHSPNNDNERETNN